MFGLKALLAILYFGYLSATQVCPPPEDVQPCSCFGTTYILTAHCNGVSSLDQLKNSVKGFQGTKLYIFTITSSSVEYLPSDIFENLTIQHLSISKSSMSRIANLGDPQFKGLERSLQSLTITDTFTRDHPFAYVFMDHLKALMTMDLRKNHVEVLHNEWFKNGLPDLRILRFVECQIRRVGYRALQKLHNLRILDLSDNMINYIPRTALPQPATSLEELNLERNDFHSLPKTFSATCPA
ncbi:uncharacterized protein CEXT_460271 [Caerostris extrusa]|uniref:Uncharacterized protein n=1 Tax=Caerostris extrusa TaxID=172846 RepID=A0AAV4WD62_CAEEX|nr:uncharacterized protein CEXT_460271 [Caerostris extrusa]